MLAKLRFIGMHWGRVVDKVLFSSTLQASSVAYLHFIVLFKLDINCRQACFLRGRPFCHEEKVTFDVGRIWIAPVCYEAFYLHGAFYLCTSKQGDTNTYSSQGKTVWDRLLLNDFTLFKFRMTLCHHPEKCTPGVYILRYFNIFLLIKNSHF